ncbi:MAG: hypothetical protein QM654_03310 [Dysgonamonadaceae bacterium]
MIDKATVKLIEAMNENLPIGESLVPYLSDILSVGKEAVYRRLRRDVPFTFNEVKIIADRFHISLDELIVCNPSKRQALFESKNIGYENAIEKYMSILDNYNHLFSRMKKDETSSMFSAFNILPHTFYIGNELILKFHFFQWLYHSYIRKEKLTFSTFELPEQFNPIRSNFHENMQSAFNSIFILDENIFTKLAHSIMYFYHAGGIEQSPKEALKHELLRIIEEIEILTIKGEYESGRKIDFYLSPIHIDSSYTLYKAEDTEVALFRVFLMNSFESQNKMVCKFQKDWLNSQREHSILITKSGHQYRNRFFTDQYRKVKAIFDEEGAISTPSGFLLKEFMLD